MKPQQRATFLTIIAMFAVAGIVYLSYLGLQNRYRNLESSYANLQQMYAEILNEISSLSENVSSLQSRVDNMQALVNSKRAELQAAQNLIDQMKRRVSPTFAEMKTYVTPNDPQVFSKVREIGGTGQWDWNVARKILDWVTTNVDYEEDPHIPNPYDYGETTINELWKYPSETLAELKGDCEDQATLLCSMLRANGSVGSFVLLVFSQSKGHALVITRVEGQNAAIWDPCYKWTEYAFVEITCEHCGGTGKVNCTYCNGTGKITCWWCNGSGKCPWCGGWGTWLLILCPFCGGTGKCSACGGTGLMNCWACGGTGKTTCWYCGGKGTVLRYQPVKRSYYNYGNYLTVWSDYKSKWGVEWVPRCAFNEQYYRVFSSEADFLNWLAGGE